MLVRLAVVMLNTYREAVRARVLHGLFALALVTAGYCMVVGELSTGNAPRVLSNLGAASVALYGSAVAIVLSATALHREIELKTLFPILARPIARWEYVVGKYLGTLLTLGVFVLGNAAVFLGALAVAAGTPLWQPLVLAALAIAGLALIAWRAPRWATVAPAIAALLLMLAAAWLSANSPDDRRVLLCSAVLTVLEVGVVGAVALLFSAFSSPFLTAILTLGVFIVGRSADTLAELPPRMFGEGLARFGQLLSRVVPNLMLYVPERAVLTGESLEGAGYGYLGLAALQTLGWAVLLLGVASWIFRRRDLT
ncbi:MAG TPA: ABC transporter permease subunit [Polyangiaceae bacterium]|jgi:ABC-type transport system involved in multi-copper enzyme maturation permease subunit|nr:ABC transporter permease subunit [Polyangiaceae bacterium]